MNLNALLETVSAQADARHGEVVRAVLQHYDFRQKQADETWEMGHKFIQNRMQEPIPRDAYGNPMVFTRHGLVSTAYGRFGPAIPAIRLKLPEEQAPVDQNSSSCEKVAHPAVSQWVTDLLDDRNTDRLSDEGCPNGPAEGSLRAIP